MKTCKTKVRGAGSCPTRKGGHHGQALRDLHKGEGYTVAIAKLLLAIAKEITVGNYENVHKKN
jgi:hypothetical protein